MSKITHDFKSSGTIFKVTGHIFDTCVSFSIFSESLDPLVAKMVTVSREHLETNDLSIPKNHKTVCRTLQQQQTSMSNQVVTSEIGK